MKIDKKFYKKKENIQSLYDIESSKVLKIISFGSNKRFLGLSEKVLISLKKIYPNSYCKNYQKTDLDASILNYCNQYKKGYGYWIWKPYLILKSLRQLPIGANLLYVDGRTGLHKKCKKIEWLDKFINSDKYDIGLFKTVHKEYKWTSGDLFSLFNLKLSSNEANTMQYCATYLCLKNNLKTQKFIEAWLNILINKNRFCRDEISTKPNHENFIQNRHDQSVLSLLTKISKKSLNLKIFLIPHPLKVNRPTLIPHFYYRPTGFLNLLKRYIKLLFIVIGLIDKKYIGKYYEGLKID